VGRKRKEKEVQRGGWLNLVIPTDNELPPFLNITPRGKKDIWSERKSKQLSEGQTNARLEQFFS